MRKLLTALSGARPEVLDRCPSEQGKFEGIGGAVLTTCVLAVVSMTFALHSALGVSLLFAIPASLVWGLAIMSLDRWLVGSIQADDARRWKMAIPRILMAVLIGFVISTPLVLRIFKSEIDVQIAQIKQTRSDTFANEQKRGAVGQEVTRLGESVAGLEKVIASGGDVPLDPAKDPKIQALTAERDAQQLQAAKLYKDWQCQLYGGTKCRKGDGVLARASKSAYDKANGQVNGLNRQIGERRRQLTATDDKAKQARLASARDDLPGVKVQLKEATDRQSALRKSFDAENDTTDGLLIRLQALNEVSGKDFTLRLAHILLFLLFLLIECLPVTVKLLQKPGNYEKIYKLTVREEYRAARDRLGPQGSAQPGAGSLYDIWAGSVPDADPASGHTAPLPPDDEVAPARSDEDWPAGHPSFEHEALRDMPDTRIIAREPGTHAKAGERPEEFELFPGDD
ncbi:DUF4407 domain-containing protein [Actinomadura sp. DC4]|uniref:DUF4407 domain-containing protein n=1 Tax=Actinomadura sp. DC4 TaxID=3055069 RepID=UPI0025B155C1|nr:DUF4407 domain-containing protein [Actinomadura sp. DC4]MDN3351450.1 DUF4407 domain-containing protein [Actinomadura sp. DC4]